MQNKNLICMEPIYKAQADKLQEKILKTEKEAEDILEKICFTEILIINFEKEKIEPKLKKLEDRLNNLKILLGMKSKSEKKYKKENEKNTDEENLKGIYRKLAKAYHPDKNASASVKNFYCERMKEINLLFSKKDINGLKRILRKSFLELQNGDSNLFRMEKLKKILEEAEEEKRFYSDKMDEVLKSARYKATKMKEEELKIFLSEKEEEIKREIKIYSEIFYSSLKKR